MKKKTKPIKHIFTKEERKFILKNYPKYGLKYCISNSFLSQKSISAFVTMHKLKVVRRYINIDINNKYFCYILGLIWADGSVDKKYNKISISLKQKDMNNLRYIF